MEAGDVYRHNKTGNLYVILALAQHHEHKSLEVIYQRLSDKHVWRRTPEDFEKLVNLEGREVPRFEKVDERVIFLDQYQELAMRTAGKLDSNPVGLNYGALGAAGEAGETQDLLAQLIELALDALKHGAAVGKLADYLKKHLFHEHALHHERVVSELGDCDWYKARICRALGLTYSDIATYNIKKLRKRYPDGFSKKASQERAREE